MLAVGSTVCVATDTRTSGQVLKGAVTSGLLSSGTGVVDFGITPTPALARLTRELRFATGIMVTASHNPHEFNGIKLFNEDSLGYSKDQEAQIEDLCSGGELRSGPSPTVLQHRAAKEVYFRFMEARFPRRGLSHGLRILVDAGNGAATGFAGELFRTIGFDTVAVNDEPDGLFPGRGPEPKEDMLQGTVESLRQHDADLAVCFDGDADRVVFCDKEGFLGLDEMIAFISRLFVMETGRKRVATTVETGRLFDLALEDLGVEITRGKVGDVEVAHLARELDAAIGVEGVGVYIIPKVGYHPDSFVAALTLAGYLGSTREIRGFFDGLPRLFLEKRKVPCPNEIKEDGMAEVARRTYLFGGGEVNTIDGLRLEYDDSWMLIRASGTEPAIRVIAESPSPNRTRKLLAEGTEVVRSCLARCSN